MLCCVEGALADMGGERSGRCGERGAGWGCTDPRGAHSVVQGDLGVWEVRDGGESAGMRGR